MKTFLLLVLSLSCIAIAAPDPVPQIRAHAHNDYEHPRPLLDALDCGFGSIEADIHLVAGRLLVAHDRQAVKQERTLQALYLDPLRNRVMQNGGRVYRDGPPIILLVDIKTEAVPTYTALHEVLANYTTILTIFRDGVAIPGAVTVIVSGSRNEETMAAQKLRYAAMDGRIEDLERQTSKGLIPLVSDNWQKVFTWRWKGTMPPDEARKLKGLVEQAHAGGKLIRFWNTPDTMEAWKFLHDAGVDLINTDQLAGLQAFLLTQKSDPSK